MNAHLARLFHLSRNSFREAVRQKFFTIVVVIGAGLMLGSRFFQQLDFGSAELKFIADIGLGAIFFFGAILAIVLAAQLFFTEIENRTAHSILAKPVHRWEFVVGKFLGAFVVMAIFTYVMTLLLAGMLLWRETELTRFLRPDEIKEQISYGGLFIYASLQLGRFAIVIAFTLFIASFANTNLYTIVMSFFVLMICQLQYLATNIAADAESWFTRGLVGTLALLFPNFQVYNVAEALVFAGGEDWNLSGTRITLFSCSYVVVFLGLTAFSFSNREF